jgi:DNA (cytosine-5)-methyltransferase 1
MTFGSLFAGIGGMDLGLERAGMSCKWQVEIDPYARRVLARHWPDVARWDDVRTFPPDMADSMRDDRDCAGPVEIGSSSRAREAKAEADRRRVPDQTGGSRAGSWHVDLICGGFPCQDISFAGKGAGLAGERSGLWYEFARVVRVLRPRYVLVENVAALLVRGLDAVLGTLAADGYDAEWFCLPAAAVGAPHRRDRVFIVAHAAGVRLGGDEPRGHHEAAGQQRGRVPGTGRGGDGAAIPHPHQSRPAVGRRIGSDARAKLAAFERANRQAGGQWGRDPADDPESGVGRVVAGLPHRVDRLRGLGNAVVPQVAEFIGRLILEHAEHQA